MKNQKGFTIIELLVSMGIFAIVSMGLMGFTSSALRELSDQSRLSFATLELKNALSMLSSEVRMSSAISPYIPGNNSALTNCSSTLSVTSTSISFIVAEDDASALTTGGIRPYYVAYSYDATNKKLLRGEIQASSTTSCSLPAGNPFTPPIAKTLSERVTQIDANADGSLEPIFAINGNVLAINLGVEVLSTSGNLITQNFSTHIYLRTN